MPNCLDGYASRHPASSAPPPASPTFRRVPTPRLTDAELAALPVRDGMRLRGLDNTRLDTFVDAAFAFGSTVLLISSGDMPTDYAQLVSLMRDVPAFVLSFFTLMIFWLSHRQWSRAYGLENGRTLFLTLLLVVTVLVYVYPLKLMYATMIGFFAGGALDGGLRVTDARQGLTMMQLYGVGFTVLSGTLLGLYAECLRRRDELRLDDEERVGTGVGVAIWGTLTAVGILATLGATLLPPRYGVWSAFAYWLLAPGVPLAIRVARRRLRG